MRECCVCDKRLDKCEFEQSFIEFVGIPEAMYKRAFLESHAYVDPRSCPSGWSPEQHKLAVMLGIAHCLYKMPSAQVIMKKNGVTVEDFAGKGNISMATEGSVSIMKKVYSPATATENDLLGSIYGEELLALYEGINPPMITPHPAPYFPVGY